MKIVKRWWRPVLLGLACAGMLAAVAQTALAGDPTAPRPSDLEVAARAEAPPGDAPDLRLTRPEGDWVGGLGVVEPAAPEAELSFAQAGRIAAVHVAEGDFVEAGTVLVELETGVEAAALAAAEAELAAAEAELTRVRRGARPEERTALTNEAEAAAARAALSQGVLERLEVAAAGGGVSSDALERARRQAEADARAAQSAAARRDAGRRGRSEDVRLADARRAAAEARRDQARATLAERRIVAPVAGEILVLRHRVGEYVQPGGSEAAVVLGDTRTLRARIDVDERDVGRVARDGRALVVADAYPDTPFEGRVVSIARRMGRKNVRTDEPTERIDTKILEVVVELGAEPRLVVGQRVMGYLERAETVGAATEASATAAP